MEQSKEHDIMKVWEEWQKRALSGEQEIERLRAILKEIAELPSVEQDTAVTIAKYALGNK